MEERKIPTVTEIEYEQNEIIFAEDVAENIRLFEVFAPVIAQKAVPGQFVVIRIDDYSERIPLTIADVDQKRFNITLVVQLIGASTRKIGNLGIGDIILDVVGPLGQPSEIRRYGTAVCIGGGVGIAPVYPVAKALKAEGNRVISIIGVKSKSMLFFEEEMEGVSDELYVTTDDGRYGRKGFVTDELERLIEKGETIDYVTAVGPLVMMKAVSDITREQNIKTVVSLNSIMVDGTGMCGGCRVTIGKEAKFACVDGPEFDGHLVDFDQLLQRQDMYSREEYRALWHYQCRLEEEMEKQKAAEERVTMPNQDPVLRTGNFDEVALGYSKEEARREALRCLQCKKAPCIKGCPVEIDIPSFIKMIQKGDYLGAVHKIKERNNMPAICGRVCPQEVQCERACVLHKKGKPIAVGNLERFVADYEFQQGNIRIPKRHSPTGKNVAVVGAGPAGLTAAAELAKMGHGVTLFEALHKPGGVLIYGIPEFRLPNRIVQIELDYISSLGVEVRTNYIVGKSGSVDELMNDGYDAVFLGTGAGLPYFLGIPGEQLNGVYSANEFLTRVNLMKAYLFPEYDTPVRIARKMAVIGGGNVALDAARTALRLGAEEVSLIYRRSRSEMPAREHEIVNAEEEGIKFVLLTTPVRITGNEKGWVNAVECEKMKLGEPDESGRRRPIPVKGSKFQIEAGVVIVAIGQGPNPVLTSATPDLKTNKWGNIVADEETCKTNKKGVFAGGDIVTGAATVILAIGAGKRGAVAIDKYLSDGKW